MAGGKPAVTVEGADKTARAFGKAADRLQDRELRRTHLAAGDVLADQARRDVPVRTGALRRTVDVFAEKGGAVVRAGSRTVRYARPINYGWPARGIRAQPFLGEGTPDRTDDVRDVYVDRVGAVVRTFDREAS